MQSEHAYLILIQNGEQKEIFSLVSSEIVTLGRATENTISFFDDRCSRFHAKIFYNEGIWYLQDLRSRNGTYIDGAAVSTEMIPLSPGQRIQIGHTMLQFGCGEPGNADTCGLDGSSDAEHTPTGLHKSGIFGIDSDRFNGPRHERSHVSKIVRQVGHSSILRPDDTRQEINITTRVGYGPLELCRLAFQLGKADEVEQVAKLAIEGLLNATGAEGVGLWLFPYNLNSTQKASDIRLVADITLEQVQYKSISELLVRTVFEKKEAFLFHEVPPGTKSDESQTKLRHQYGNNTLAAPVRFQNGILGLLHLYTVAETKCLDESDLEYTLAVADTVGSALAHINKQKELAANLNQMQQENESLREMLQTSGEIIGQSSPIKIIHHLISRAAEGKTSLLIRGESGVGKELVARAVHFASARRTKPLVCLNCAAISESLLESELFGHEKGAFTGATERKIGKFEAANSGTLFLDEIGEMSPALQTKFLRVIEGGSFERVGGNITISVDVRVIAATNRDLEKEVSAGRFRHDLFFRLRVLEIIVPPLRKRTDDIPILADYFLDKFCKETGRKYKGFSSDATRALMSHQWPGNIRELKNVIERAVVLGSGQYIQEHDLLLSTLKTAGETDQKSNEKRVQDVFIPLSLEDMEKNHIIRTLEHVQWNKSVAAQQLGIERTTLDRKIKRYDLVRNED